MATMFYQQLINRKTVSSRWPFSNSLTPATGRENTRDNARGLALADAAARARQRDRERGRGKRGTRRRTLSEESLCEPSPPRWKGEIYGPAFVHEWSAHVQEVFKRRVLTSAYLHTSGLRKHLLKPPLPPSHGLSKSIRSLRSRFIDRSRIVEQYIARCTRPATDR